MQEFTYHAPTSLAEALHLLQQDPAQTRLLAGGTDLFLDLSRRGVAVRHVVDLKGIAELVGIRRDAQGACTIGALTLAADVEASAELTRDYPAFVQGAAVVGGPPIRNRATIGGNLCNASPAADTSTPLLALDARVVIAGVQGRRDMPLHELWQRPRHTTLTPGEILQAIVLPAPAARSGSAFERLTRSAMDIALVNAAAAAALDGAGRIVQARLALGAVAPTALRVDGIEEALAGQRWSLVLEAQVARRAAEAARPIDDIRASAAYRREMAGVLAARAMARAVAMASGNSARHVGGRT